MDYTTSDSYATHAATGHRMHQMSAPVPTQVTDKDLNSVIWSLMKVIADGGITPATFSVDDPASYDRLSLAIQRLAGASAGFVGTFAGAAAPSGWLACDGAAVLRATYPALFNAIGTRYNAGTEAGTEFRLPNLADDFVRGASSTRPVGTREAQQTARHQHAQAHGEAFLENGLFGASSTAGYLGSHGGTDSDNYLYLTNDGSTYSTATPNAAGVIGDETRPRNVALLYCIKF